MSPGPELSMASWMVEKGHPLGQTSKYDSVDETLSAAIARTKATTEIARANTVLFIFVLPEAVSISVGVSYVWPPNDLRLSRSAEASAASGGAVGSSRWLACRLCKTTNLLCKALHLAKCVQQFRESKQTKRDFRWL